MLGHILVALESLNAAEYVLSHAAGLAHASKARLTLLHLLNHPSGKNRGRFVDPVDWHIRKLEANANLKQLADRLRKTSLKVDTTVLESADPENLIQYAHTHDVSLMVLSKQTESVGDLVHNVMKQTTTPLLILQTGGYLVNDNQPFDCYHKILIPLDGSQRAECTLPIATSLAQSCDAQLLLAHVIRKPEMPRRAMPTTDDLELSERLIENNRNEAARYLEQVATRLPGNVQTHLLIDNNIATSLHRLVEQEGVDLVILSAHGYTGEPEWPYGSVTNNVLAYSKKPVLVLQDLPAPIVERTEAQAVSRSGKAR